jgi:hypothetical protein
LSEYDARKNPRMHAKRIKTKKKKNTREVRKSASCGVNRTRGDKAVVLWRRDGVVRASSPATDGASRYREPDPRSER